MATAIGQGTIEVIRSHPNPGPAPARNRRPPSDCRSLEHHFQFRSPHLFFCRRVPQESWPPYISTQRPLTWSRRKVFSFPPSDLKLFVHQIPRSPSHNSLNSPSTQIVGIPGSPPNHREGTPPPRIPRSPAAGRLVTSRAGTTASLPSRRGTSPRTSPSTSLTVPPPVGSLVKPGDAGWPSPFPCC